MEPESRRRQLQRLGREAAEYYRSRQVPQRLEEALNSLFLLRPADLYGDLANYFSKFSKAPVICKLVGRKVLDGVGRPTLEVEIYCIIKNHEKRICSTIISSHSHILENTLSGATEADEKERNDSVNTAVEWVNESLNTMLRDLKPTDQCVVDKILGIGGTTWQHYVSLHPGGCGVACLSASFEGFLSATSLNGAVATLNTGYGRQAKIAVGMAKIRQSDLLTPPGSQNVYMAEARIDAPNPPPRMFFSCEYFTKKAEEKKEIQKKDEEEATLSLPSCIPSATALSEGKKAATIGKKVSSTERTIPPAEPVESEFCGSLAIGGTSLAVAKSGAIISRIPLYLHIALLKHNQYSQLQDTPKEMTVPLPMVSLLNCGKFSPGKLKLMKEVMLIPPVQLSLKQSIERVLDIQREMMRLLEPTCKAPSPQLADRKKGSARSTGKKVLPPAIKRVSHLGCLITGCDNLEQPLLLVQTACSNIGLELGTDIYLAINCAAHELIDYLKGKYEILTGAFKSPDEMVDMYVELINRFPSIIALVDPFRKEDRQQWNNICCALGSKCYLIAEDAATSISKLTTDQDMNLPKCSGIVLKYINQTKVSDLIELTGLLDGQRHITILGSPDGESSDDSLVDLAVGLGAKFVKLGGLSRGERVTKYNRLLAIEEELAKNRTLRFEASFEFIDFAEETQPEQLSDVLPSPAKQDLLPPLSSQPVLQVQNLTTQLAQDSTLT